MAAVASLRRHPNVVFGSNIVCSDQKFEVTRGYGVREILGGNCLKVLRANNVDRISKAIASTIRQKKVMRKIIGSDRLDRRCRKVWDQIDDPGHSFPSVTFSVYETAIILVLFQELLKLLLRRNVSDNIAQSPTINA